MGCLFPKSNVYDPQDNSIKRRLKDIKKDKSSMESNEDFNKQNKSNRKNKKIKVEDVKAKQNLGDNSEINDDELDCVRSIFLWVI